MATQVERIIVEYDAKTDGYDTKMEGIHQTNKKVNSSVSGVGRSAGMAGIQVQQFVGQIQGGQSAMLALSQQSADLGFVLGAPLLGAVVGIGASIAGIMLPNLLGAKKGMEALNEQTQILSEITRTASDGTILLSDSLAKLAKKSKDAAMVEVALGISSANKAIKAAKEEVDDAAKSWQGFGQILDTTLGAAGEYINLKKIALEQGKTEIEVLDALGDSYTGTIKGIGVLNDVTDKMSKKLGVNREQALSVISAYGEFKKSGTNEDIKTLSSLLADLAVNTKKPTKELLEMAKRISSASVSMSDSEAMIELFKGALTGLDEVVATSNESINSYVEGLEQQVMLLGLSAKAVALYQKASEGASAEQLTRIALAYDELEVEKEKNRVKKEGAKLFDMLSTVDPVSQASTSTLAEIMQRDEVNALKLEQEQAFLETLAELKFTGQETEEEMLAKEVELHRAMLDSKLINIEQFNEAQKHSAKKYEKSKQEEVKTDKKTSIEKLQTQQNGIRAGMALNSALFDDNKAIAAGLIVADTATGIQKSLAINPYDYVNVGIIAATGAANLANALGASKGGGSISSGSSGGAAVEAQQPQAVEQSSLSLSTQDESGSNEIVVRFATDSGDDYLDMLANGLNERNRQGR